MNSALSHTVSLHSHLHACFPSKVNWLGVIRKRPVTAPSVNSPQYPNPLGWSERPLHRTELHVGLPICISPYL